MQVRKITVMSGKDCPTLSNCAQCPNFCGIILVVDEFKVLCGSAPLQNGKKIIAVAHGSENNNSKPKQHDK